MEAIDRSLELNALFISVLSLCISNYWWSVRLREFRDLNEYPLSGFALALASRGPKKGGKNRYTGYKITAVVFELALAVPVLFSKQAKQNLFLMAFAALVPWTIGVGLCEVTLSVWKRRATFKNKED
jgi:hypothetical protein